MRIEDVKEWLRHACTRQTEGIYHIVHVDRLSSIVDGWESWCDAKSLEWRASGSGNHYWYE